MPEVDADKITMERICCFINGKIKSPNVAEIKIVYDHESPMIQKNWKDSWLTIGTDADGNEKILIRIRLKQFSHCPMLISLELFRQDIVHWRVTKGLYPKSGAKDLHVYFDGKILICEFDDDEITVKTEDYEKNRHCRLEGQEF